MFGAGSVGGLIGDNKAAINAAYASGSVTGTASAVGGLIGLNVNGAVITNTYAYGTVNSSSTEVGGLVGDNSGSVSTSYASGWVQTGGANTGGFVGRNNATGSITRSFWDTDASLRSAGFGSNTGTITNLTGGCFAGGCTNGGTANLSDLTTYSAAPFSWNIGTNLATNTWVIFDDLTRPLLSMESSASLVTAHSIEIIGINTTALAGNYTLTNSIDLSIGLFDTSDIWGGSVVRGWLPIGSNATAFTGTFDGGNFTLDNLYISQTADYMGFFGRTTNNISNLNLTNVVVTGANRVGGLVGLASSGTISNVVTTGVVVGTAGPGATYIGGMIGEGTSANVSNSHNEASVTGNTFGTLIGGLMGYNASGTISNSYNTGSVTVTSGVQLGGLIGENGGTITSSYNLGNVSAPSTLGNGGSDIGGLVGINGSVTNSGTITNSYSNAIVSGGSSVQNIGGLAGSNGSGTITGSYSAGAVIAGGSATNVAGLVGDNSGFYVAAANIINSYSTATVSAGGLSVNVAGLVALNVASTFGVRRPPPTHSRPRRQPDAAAAGPRPLPVSQRLLARLPVRRLLQHAVVDAAGRGRHGAIDAQDVPDRDRRGVRRRPQARHRRARDRRGDRRHDGVLGEGRVRLRLDASTARGS